MYKPNPKNEEQLRRLQAQLQSNDTLIIGQTCIPSADIEKATPEQALGEALQQYLNIFFLKLAGTYPLDAPEWREKSKSEQLQQFRDFFLLDTVLSFIRIDHAPRLLSKSELEQLLFQSRLTPPAPDWFSPVLKSLRHTLDELFRIRESAPVEIWRNLYIVEKRMQKILQHTTISRQLIRNYLDSYTNQQLSRLSAGRLRRLQWGQELEEYYQEECRRGLNDRTALIAARQRFKQAHPITPDPNDSDVITPGLTAASLNSYHTAYLESIGRK